MGKGKRKVPGLNQSSTADISFILLIFFLVTTSMDTDSGLSRRLPEWDPDAVEQEMKIKERNVMTVQVNKNNEIFVKNGVVNRVIDISELKDIAIGHYGTIAEHFGAAWVGDELGVLLGEHPDGFFVKVVMVLMGDEDKIRFGHGGIVDGLRSQLGHGVDLDFFALIFDTHGGVDQGMDLDRLPAFGGETVDFVSWLAAGG